MKNELYEAIKSYCDENHCWQTSYKVKEWNEILDTNYSATTFTALVKDGRLVREQGYREKTYSYTLAPTPEMLQKEAETKKQREIDSAKYRVEHYDEFVARIRARYEEAIKEAEERLKRDLEWEAKRLAEAQELLNNI